jgi:predicted dehydrogenase
MGMSAKHARRLRVGVIGAGEFAEVGHIPGLQSHPNAEVVAICGRRLEATRALADRFGVPDVHVDYHELCARSDIDAVTVVTPNHLHCEQALTACARGKHVFCEKPLGMNTAEARAMRDAAEKAGVVHQVGFVFRYGFAVPELRRRVQAGDIGEPYYLRIQYDGWDGLEMGRKVMWQDKKATAGAGVLFNIGSHLFDIVRYAAGPIDYVTGFLHHLPRLGRDSVTGKASAIETDEIAAAWFRHASGLRGQWFIGRITPPFAEKGYLEVIGPEGALKAGLSRGGVDRLKASRPGAPEWQELPLPPEAGDGQPHSLGRMMRSFVDACLRGRLVEGTDASFADGFEAQAAMEAVIEADRNLSWMRLSSESEPRFHG